MAELEESVSEDFLAETNQQYSFTECKQIGREFLDDLKQSLKATTLQEIEEPRAKATKYLEKTEVLQLLEVSYHHIYLDDCKIYPAIPDHCIFQIVKFLT